MKKLVEITITVLVDDNDDATVVADTLHNTFDANQYGWITMDCNVTNQTSYHNEDDK
jgi:hypothetical protein